MGRSALSANTRRARYSGWEPVTNCPVTGKPGYVSRREAKKAATELRYRSGGKVLKPYRCPKCDAFHLTSKEQRGY